MDINTDSPSFNGIVYNVYASPNLVFQDGVTYPGVTATPGWNRILYEQAIQGFYPCMVQVFRSQDNSTPQTLVYNDTQLGDMQVTMSVDGSHRYQNVTPANHPGPEANVPLISDTNRNSISANPLSGKLYTFSHLAPKYNTGWMNRQTLNNIVDLNLFSGRPLGTLDRTLGNDKSKQWDYAAISAYGPGTFPQLPEFQRPPLRASTLFSNVKTTGPVSMSPGAIRTFTTKFSYQGTLTRLLIGLTQITRGSISSGIVDQPGKFPTIGDSFMMCLNPTMKTRENESVMLGFQYTKVGKAYLTSKRGGFLPTTNLEYEA